MRDNDSKIMIDVKPQDSSCCQLSGRVKTFRHSDIQTCMSASKRSRRGTFAELLVTSISRVTGRVSPIAFKHKRRGGYSTVTVFKLPLIDRVLCTHAHSYCMVLHYWPQLLYGISPQLSDTCQFIIYSESTVIDQLI